ncbi:MAG: hypothetical protein V1753_08370 [Pseudomonadota bacterium]
MKLRHMQRMVSRVWWGVWSSQPNRRDHGSKKQKKKIYYSAIEQVGFIRDTSQEGLGKVFGSRSHMTTMGAGEVIYVTPRAGGHFSKGDRFAVLRIIGTISHPYHQEDEIIAGIQHLIVGLVDVMDVRPDLVICKVLKAYKEIESGDILVSYEQKSPEIERLEPLSGFEAVIIGVDQEEKSSILWDYMVVFIDKGRKDGVKAGQSYSVYVQEKKVLDSGEEEHTVIIPPRDIGSIIVLNVEEKTSAVLITSSLKAISIGEKIHTPQ